MIELDTINSIAWFVGNLLIAYIAIGVLIFVTSYYVLFDPSATTAGRMIFRFFLSLIGIIGLVFIGIYVDPAEGRDWTQMPSDVDSWRPILRVGIYGYVSYAITSLAVLLAIRKWRPQKVHKYVDREMVKVRSTGPVHTIHIKK